MSTRDDSRVRRFAQGLVRLFKREGKERETALLHLLTAAGQDAPMVVERALRLLRRRELFWLIWSAAMTVGWVLLLALWLQTRSAFHLTVFGLYTFPGFALWVWLWAFFFEWSNNRRALYEYWQICILREEVPRRGAVLGLLAHLTPEEFATEVEPLHERMGHVPTSWGQEEAGVVKEVTESRKPPEPDEALPENQVLFRPGDLYFLWWVLFVAMAGLFLLASVLPAKTPADEPGRRLAMAVFGLLALAGFVGILRFRLPLLLEWDQKGVRLSRGETIWKTLTWSAIRSVEIGESTLIGGHVLKVIGTRNRISVNDGHYRVESNLLVNAGETLAQLAHDRSVPVRKRVSAQARIARWVHPGYFGGTILFATPLLIIGVALVLGGFPKSVWEWIGLSLVLALFGTLFAFTLRGLLASRRLYCPICKAYRWFEPREGEYRCNKCEHRYRGGL